MNKREREFFDALHKDRADSANTFEKPSNRGMWQSHVEKYSDQAHFIYELIQNADDAGAKTARFILESDRLIFAHNGTRHFSISNPKTEDKDSKEGRLGDINAITGIAFSNKRNQENKIGKFGEGFKAVFQYTATPRIYDPKFHFRIDRYIVPSLLEEDYTGRRYQETLFVFPFDHKDRTPQKTYADIKKKLKNLSYPILLLQNLRSISFESGNTVGKYDKTILETETYRDGTVAEKICLKQKLGDKVTSKNLWLFTRYDNGLSYSVGFFIDGSNHLIPVREPAFCYFPTKESTGLNFLIHAPFILTDSREAIRSGDKHNDRLILLLAKLAGTSLLYLRDIGEKESKRIIDDDILTIVPINEDAFCELDDTDSISFKPFYTEIKKILSSKRIIPTRTGYTASPNAYWAAVPYLAELFSDKQLAAISGNPTAKWAFPSLGRDEVQRNDEKLFVYIESITYMGLSEQHLIRGRYTNYGSRVKDINGIADKFIENQPVEWLHKLYKWLSETSQRTEWAKTVPIFLDQDSKAAAAYSEDGGYLTLFLPNDDIHGCRIVREDLLQISTTKKFINKIGIIQPSIRDEIYNVIIPQYKNGDKVDANAHFRLFFKYYRQCPQEEVDDFIEEISNYSFIAYTTQDNPQIHYETASSLYFPTDELHKYFESKPTTKFVTYDEYLQLYGAANEKVLCSFLEKLGVQKSVSIFLRKLDWTEQYERDDLPRPYSTQEYKYAEYNIDGCKELINYIVKNKSAEKSFLLWKQLLKIQADSNYRDLSNLLYGRCDYFYYTNKYKSFASSDAVLLKSAAWLVDKNGNFKKVNEVSRSTLSDGYNFDDAGIEKLLDFMGIIDETVDLEAGKEDDSNLTDNQREKVKFADRATELGLTIEDLEELARIKKSRDTYDRKTNNSVQRFTDKTESDQLSRADSECEDGLIPEASMKQPPQKTLNMMTSRVARDILSKINSVPVAHEDNSLSQFEDVDEDEYTPSVVDFSKRIETEKEKAAKAIDKIAYQEELQKQALEAEKYTYGWFKSLLKLEMLNSSTVNLNSKEISICFARVEREPRTQRTLVLKQPNRFIP